MNNDKKMKEQAVYWLSCEKEGFTESRKLEFENWLKENPSHQKVYNRMKFIHKIPKSLSEKNREDLSQKVHKELSKTKLSLKIKYYYSGAAVLILILFFSLFKTYDNNSLQYEKIYVTDVKNLSKQSLPDGSIISLDAKTNLNIEFYKNRREAFLTNGKVIFSIAKDKSRPFVISSDNIQIEVVGTKFEVINLDNKITINVQEGRVKTYHLNKNKKRENTIILTKADTITYTNKGEVNNYSKINPEKIAIWQDDLINFNQVTLKEAFTEFAKYTNHTFEFSSNEIKNYLVTGEFKSNQLDIFLNTIIKIYPIKIEKKDKTIKIIKK
ncbi:FecR family protein [Halarcobacter anaerophilus]|uniref:Siderophore-interacting protein n=1 Tax=Halarcobacter anaerophilus TaxID=877500 RepID=A0A4Q0Y037_9BACT|nr:FecR domain-containing protein [Halarcobacter anaerophilus]QDF28543.1 sigma factor regulatory protein, FecR family [Halarcobacter anaerophilus]RXJ63272.1 siderophore-interacting protein [Halarcobacter anaerophilus]